MRAAVLVFMCVIGVTLALPSFRTKGKSLLGNQRDTRIAGLLEKLLGSADKDTPTQQLRSQSEGCQYGPSPCADRDRQSADFGLCVFEEFGKIKHDANELFIDIHKKPLFEPDVIDFYYKALDVLGDESMGLLIHLYASYGYTTYVTEAANANGLSTEMLEREHQLGCDFHTLLGEFYEEK